MKVHLDISLVIKVDAITCGNALQLLPFHSLHIGGQVLGINLRVNVKDKSYSGSTLWMGVMSWLTWPISVPMVIIFLSWSLIRAPSTLQSGRYRQKASLAKTGILPCLPDELWLVSIRAQTQLAAFFPDCVLTQHPELANLKAKMKGREVFRQTIRIRT